MANAFFYGMCRYVQDAQNNFVKSVELEVTLAGDTVEYSDQAAPLVPAVGDPVLWYMEFPNSNDYATMLAGCCPSLPPSSSDIFTFCTRTYGGQVQVCDFDLPGGGAWLNDLKAYLAYYFPALSTAFLALGLGPQTTKVAVLNAISQIVQPGVSAVTSNFPGG